MKRIILIAAVVIVIAVLLWLFFGRERRSSVRPIGTPVQIAAPLGLPPVPIPVDNPPTAETIALGRRLFYDPILSTDNTVSCATCHSPNFGFSDGKQFSEGIRQQKGNRNAPTVFNAAYYTDQFWDGRAPSLEKQAEGPVQNPIEMGHTLEGVEKQLIAVPELMDRPRYRVAFEKAFGPGTVTYEMVGKAIASFERTVVSGNSPFDRYFYGGDQSAMSDLAKLGFEVFRDPKKGNCAVCHTIGEKHALFTDNKFHNIGVGIKDEQPTDLGRYLVTKKNEDRGAFKTPSLRNVALTVPYLHDGSAKSLKDVVDHYIGGGSSSPHLDKEIKVLDFLSGEERASLVAFMEALTGEMPPNVGPPGGRSRSAMTQQVDNDRTLNLRAFAAGMPILVMGLGWVLLRHTRWSRKS